MSTVDQVTGIAKAVMLHVRSTVTGAVVPMTRDDRRAVKCMLADKLRSLADELESQPEPAQRTWHRVDEDVTVNQGIIIPVDPDKFGEEL